MKKFTYILLLILAGITISCTQWVLPEACNEPTPTDFSLKVEGDVISCSIASSNANWSLISSNGTGKIVKEQKLRNTFNFNKNDFLADNYQIKVNGTTACGFPFNLQKNICSEALPKKISCTFNDSTTAGTVITYKSTVASNWTITDKSGLVLVSSTSATNQFSFKMFDYVGKVTTINLSGKSICGEEFKVSVMNPFYFEMVRVRGKEFEMGNIFNDTPKIDNEYPVHKVKVSDFLMSKYKVTDYDWFNFMNSDSGTQPAGLKRERAAGVDYKYAQVKTFNEIQPFLEKINSKSNLVLRLPTEAEWEYVAGNGVFPGERGSSYVERLRTKTVGYSLLYGINVDAIAEFVSDYYAPYSSGVTILDPKGLASGTLRIFRGGTGKYESPISYARIAYRGLYSTASTYDYNTALTFRVVLEIP